MKILYDHQMLLLQKYGGISRYFYELICRLKKMDCIIDVQCIHNRNHYFAEYFDTPPARFYERRNLLTRAINSSFEKLNQLVVLFKLRRGYDIIHPTYYNPYLTKIKNMGKSKLVLTVYDMIQELFSDQYPESAREEKRRMIFAADHIIAISESTKRDIIRIYPEIPSDRITVIYLGTNMRKAQKQSSGLVGRYVLFVGTRQGYKNFDTFVKAMIPILEANPDLIVLCIGGGPFSAEERFMMKGYDERFKQKNCRDDELSEAYTYAQCFVFPSQYEGFGIPTLEAFACDCPVVLSNTSSMPEVGGDAVIYIDPENSKDMTEKISIVLGDETLRREMIEKGRKQLAKFDWAKIATQTLECYKKVKGNG